MLLIDNLKKITKKKKILQYCINNSTMYYFVLHGAPDR